MGFLVNNMLGRAFVKVCMGLELEEQVQNVYEKQNL
jgi:hypothetical protein